MWSNNDLMDPKWTPSEPSDFERAWAKYYHNFNGVPNTVHVREFCKQYFQKRIEELEEELKSNKKHWEKMFDDARTTALNHSKELSYRAKRIEELEGQLAEIKSYIPKVPTEPYEKELARALTKERQISKLLEEALKFYSLGEAGSRARRILAEVQKLRGECTKD